MRTYYLNTPYSLFDEDKGHRLYMHWATAFGAVYLWDARLEIVLETPLNTPYPPTAKITTIVKRYVPEDNEVYTTAITRYLPYTISEGTMSIPIISAELINELESDACSTYKKDNKKRVLVRSAAIEVEFAGHKYQWGIPHGEFPTLKAECLQAIGTIENNEKILTVYTLY